MYIYIYRYIHTYILLNTCVQFSGADNIVSFVSSGNVALVYIHTYIYIQIYIHTYINTYVHTYIQTYIQTYIHTCMHAYMHTYD